MVTLLDLVKYNNIDYLSHLLSQDPNYNQNQEEMEYFKTNNSVHYLRSGRSQRGKTEEEIQAEARIAAEGVELERRTAARKARIARAPGPPIVTEIVVEPPVVTEIVVEPLTPVSGGSGRSRPVPPLRSVPRDSGLDVKLLSEDTLSSGAREGLFGDRPSKIPKPRPVGTGLVLNPEDASAILAGQGVLARGASNLWANK